MSPTGNTDYKQLLTDVIKKQMVILGPNITLAKARNVSGLTVSDDGTVTDLKGDPQELIQALIDQFVALSGLIVKKTMEPLLLLKADGKAVPEPTITPTPTPTPPPPAQETAQVTPPPPPQSGVSGTEQAV
jgi:hypothetical protein